MAPSMSIFELETLFELLPDQISRLHYLRRRAELEAVTEFEADEMDLIAFYLETSFCIPQLGQEERSEEHTSELQSLMRISYAVFCVQNKRQFHSQIKDRK